MTRRILNLAVACGAAWLVFSPAKAAQTGSVVAWGGQVMPVVQPGTRFAAIAAGGYHSLALKSDRTVVAWGDNSFAQSTVPGGLSNVIAIAAGYDHSLALVAAPALQAQISEKNIILSWPTWAQNFSLQSATNLADPNSWSSLTDVPAIVNLQNTTTNPVVDSQRFYRLKQ